GPRPGASSIRPSRASASGPATPTNARLCSISNGRPCAANSFTCAFVHSPSVSRRSPSLSKTTASGGPSSTLAGPSVERREDGRELVCDLAVETDGCLVVVRGRPLGDDREPPAGAEGQLRQTGDGVDLERRA